MMALNVNIGISPTERCGLSFCLIHKTLNVKSCVTIMNFGLILVCCIIFLCFC